VFLNGVVTSTFSRIRCGAKHFGVVVGGKVMVLLRKYENYLAVSSTILYAKTGS